MIAWIDLETTGLSTKCSIIEIAAVVTDDHYEVIEHFESLIQLPVNAVTEEYAVQMHIKSGLWEEIKTAKHSLDYIDYILSRILDRGEKNILGGSSVHFDRGFIEAWMPQVSNTLHYRNLDVSSIKKFVEELTDLNNLPPIKSETNHRAMGDIMDSLNAIRFYRENLLWVPQ